VGQSTAMQIGGGEIALALMANELSEMGHAVALVAQALHGGVQCIVNSAVRLVQFNPHSGSESSRISQYVQSATFIPRLIRTAISFGPDVVCAGSEAVGIVGLVVKYLLGTPIILFKQFGVFEQWKKLHGRSHFFWELLERRILRFPFDAILTNTVTREAALREGVQSDKIFIQTLRLVAPPTSLDCQHVLAEERIPVREGDKIILFAGRLEKVKGLHILIDALVRLPDNFNIVILGAGSEKRNLLSQVERLGLEKRIHFLGQVDYPKVASYIVRSDVVVCPSISELQGSRTMWDAFLLRTPVVATDVGDVSRLVKDRVHALLVPSDNPIELSRAILTIAEDSESTSRIVEEALSLARKVASQRSLPGFIRACHFVLDGSKSDVSI